MRLEQELQYHQFLEHLVDVPPGSRLSRQLTIKYVLDSVIAVILLVLVSPVFLLIAIGIKLSSPGPVFHVRKRAGRGRELFFMWKFRTMKHGAELEESRFLEQNKQGPFFKVKEDPRIFSFGRFLRRYSLDELPQLINVLKGEMSLVGPRPLFDFEVQEFDQWRQLRRFQMKPGITGLWQVSGRSETSAETRMQLDLQYVSNWSLLMDLEILLRTLPAVLKSRGAV